ncbi:SGNH/GDSL hydrolase family protein [Chungangia koreensis]|uniref:SGNH/GDSL hydrolase family protein n=1 Tax=Chungangia koreensis TaxID=752657 RepID=A0ABV8X2K2_9LACT
MKKIAFLIIAVFLLLTPLPVFAEQKYPIVYVAIGDSLAAGQTPNKEIDAGYSDLIAQELSRNLPVAAFTKNLSFPGYTTNDVVRTVKREETQEILGQANLITISAGANDLLRMVRHDSRSGTLSFQQIQADFALNRVRINMAEMISELKSRAPKAEIYVMGYYFPYPHVLEAQKNGTARQLNRLNEILKNVAEIADVQFVDVSKGFEQNAKDYIPNPADVHPNMEGYRIMANSFFDVMTRGNLQVSQSELPQPAPKSFEELSKEMNTPKEDETASKGPLTPNLYVMIDELHRT